jgi:hypothetical protein
MFTLFVGMSGNFVPLRLWRQHPDLMSEIRFDFPTFGKSMKLSQTAVTPCGPEVLCDRFRPKIGPATLAQRSQFHLLDRRSRSGIISAVSLG